MLQTMKNPSGPAAPRPSGRLRVGGHLALAAAVFGLPAATRAAVGSYTDIADTTITAPGESTKYYGFFTPTISGNNVVFAANYNNSSYTGIYTGTAGSTGATRIADFSTTAPGQTSTFTQLQYPAISGGNVTFVGNYNGGFGVYLNTSGATTPLARIADSSTVPTGQTNAFSDIEIPSVSGGTVAFLGGNGIVQGIYTGTASAGVSRASTTPR